MSPKAQRIAIAKAQGFYLAPEDGDESLGLWWLCSEGNPQGIGDCKADKSLCWNYTPDYLGSKDAIQEAIFSEDNFGFQLRYVSSLELVVLGHLDTSTRREVTSLKFKIYNATAAQCCIAYLIAKDLWVGPSPIKPYVE